MTLSEILAILAPDARQRLSTIHISFNTATFAPCARLHLAGVVRDHINVLDEAELAAVGVGIAAWSGLEDIEHTFDTQPAIEDQLRDIWRSGLFGELDIARFEEAGKPLALRWIVKTHAGSDEERHAWFRSIIVADQIEAALE